MKTTETAKYVAPCFPPAEPPALPTDLDDRFDLAQEDLTNTMAKAIEEWGLEGVLSMIESLEGVRVFYAPELSPSESDPEAIAEAFAQARVAVRQVVDYQQRLIDSTQEAMLRWAAETGKKVLETASAKVSVRFVTRCFSEDYAKAKAEEKKAKTAALESSAAYQRAVSEVKEIEKRDGEKVPQIAVKLFDEI